MPKNQERYFPSIGSNHHGTRLGDGASGCLRAVTLNAGLGSSYSLASTFTQGAATKRPTGLAFNPSLSEYATRPPTKVLCTMPQSFWPA